MTFTNVDKALLQRAARHLEGAALAARASVGGVWSAESRGIKMEHDRLLRDASDLRMLATRLWFSAAGSPPAGGA